MKHISLFCLGTKLLLIAQNKTHKYSDKNVPWQYHHDSLGVLRVMCDSNTKPNTTSSGILS